jgi:hypothetical protein
MFFILRFKEHNNWNYFEDHFPRDVHFVTVFSLLKYISSLLLMPFNTRWHVGTKTFWKAKVDELKDAHHLPFIKIFSSFVYKLKFIQGVREWSSKNFRVSLWGKMWSKTLVPFFPNMNVFLKNKYLKWCPTVWELLHHFIVVIIK